MPGQANSKCWHKHVENFNVDMHGRNQLHHSFLSEDTVKILAILVFRLGMMKFLPTNQIQLFQNCSHFEFGEKCWHYGQTSYKTGGCNLWISHEEKEILSYVKHFSIKNMHNMFTSSNSKKFQRKNQLFYKSLIRNSALFH